MGFDFQLLENAGIQLIDGDRGKNYPKHNDFMDNGYCLFLSAKNVTKSGFQFQETSFVNETKDRELRAGKLKYGDIVLTTRGTVGNVAYYDNNNPYKHIRINSGMIIIRADNKLWNPKFLYFILTSELLQKQIINLISGSAVPQLPARDIRKFILPVINKSLQDKITNIISDVIDKINLNIEINQTLEQMSQTLFKSWFVDFDPVIDNALDAGNPIPEALQSRVELRQKVRNSADFKPLPTEICSFFPSEFEETELGLIPKGWKFSNVNSLLKNTIGGDWGSDSRDEKHTIQAVIVRGTDIPELISGKMSSAPRRWVEPKKLEKRKINNGDIIIEVSGGSPTQSTGRSILMTERIINRLGGIIEPASFCRKFEPLSIEIGLIISLHLNKIYNDGKMWEYQNQSTGIANFQTKYFLEAEHIVFPDVEIINTFYNIVMPWIDKSHNNNQIILSNLRDTLLPKLISGELSVEDLPDLIKQTEAA